MTGVVVPSVTVRVAHTGASTRPNELGMRVMQERAYSHRGEQYLLIKSPPASGKSRALMFIALDKLNNQGVKQAIIVVPERSIGGSFGDEPLSKYGFYWDWMVRPKWNLCNETPSGEERGPASTVAAVGEFLESDDKVLVCTHATFRFAFDRYGAEAFDGRLIAVDEFHHVSANPDNRLGAQLGELIARDKAHVVAMTGSYFRGDAEAVLSPGDEAKFHTVTYTYYEQLNGYEHLKALDIGYYFYTGSYLDDLAKVLNPALKTIIHIPNVNARESTRRGKVVEVETIMDGLGEWLGTDEATGFDRVKTADGRVLKVADLVEPEPVRRAKVLNALKDPAHRGDRDHVDIIIALGMAKEGFDWIWCEHALTVGYRSSLTEIVQIIGRATRDAPNKTRSRFTNFIAEPAASQEMVVDAINDTLKAIAASLLMEQVLSPRFDFTPKNSGAREGFDYGDEGYKEGKTNVGFNQRTGQLHLEIAGLATPKSEEAKRICKEDLNEVVASFLQNRTIMERGLFSEATDTAPEELTQQGMGKIVRDRYPELSPEDQEAVRQQAVLQFNLTQQAKPMFNPDGTEEGSTAFIDGVRRYALSVRELDIDLIDKINPFEAAYAVMAKVMNEGTLKQVAATIAGKRISISFEEARDLALRAAKFKQERGRLPELTAQDAWEKKLAEGVAAFKRYKAEEASRESSGG